MVTVKNLTFGAGRPKIVVPITGITQEEIIKQAEIASHSSADVVEWRVDYYEQALDLEKLKETLTLIHLELNEKILLFTFRTTEEGGQKACSITQYKAICELAAQSSAVQMLDLELNRMNFLGRGFVHESKATGVIIVMSSHHLSTTPADGELLFQLGVMEQFGADIGKIATMATSLNDVLRVMSLKQKAKEITSMPFAIMAMGDLGKVTRLSAELIGSVFTFATLGQTSAPGQLTLALMSEVLPALSFSEDERS